MQIDKSQIIELLKSRGDHDQAAQADAELPDQVDPQAHAGILEKFGIDPQDLLGNLPGGLGDKLGGLGGLGD
jgi:hypothetical protein